MLSKKITNILLWFSFVCWVVILPVLIYCDSDEEMSINIGFKHLFGLFLNLINVLTGQAFDGTLKEQPYIVAIFSALILILLSLVWLIPCLKAKKIKTKIISAVNLAVFNLFFIIIFIVLYSTTIEIGDYTFALYTVHEKEGYTVYHTVFLVLLPFIVTIATLIPCIISIVIETKGLTDNKQAKQFNSERKAAIDLNKGQIGATGKKAVKSMVSNQELKTDPSPVSDLKSKVNRLKTQLENKDYTSSFKINNDSAMASDYDEDYNDNNQTTGYIPTSELFIKPPSVNHNEINEKTDNNVNRIDRLNVNSYEETDFIDNDELSNDQPKVTSNLIYLSASKNRFSQNEQNPSQLNSVRNQYPYNVNSEKPAARVNRAVVDSKYNNKIVIGDIDKIWDATKKARQQYTKSSDNEE